MVSPEYRILWCPQNTVPRILVSPEYRLIYQLVGEALLIISQIPTAQAITKGVVVLGPDHTLSRVGHQPGTNLSYIFSFVKGLFVDDIPNA